jgi:UDP-GlcNAc:undecaprenyl-phosphate GlcNAc-1-phosphate transferase
MSSVPGAAVLAGFLLTAVFVPLVIRLARRTGFLDHPGPRKIHSAPIPYGGGIAVAAGMLLALFLVPLALPPQTGRGLVPWGSPLIVYALGSLVILVLGLVDDRRKLSAGIKLGVETLVALGIAASGQRLELFDSGPAIGTAVTVLWILGVTNAFNLLDHMDGLSSGVAAIAGVSFLVVAFQTGQTWIAEPLGALLGACAGFLLFNFPPARIFLGDAGSLFIGFWLSCLTISFTFYEKGHYELYTYAVPVAVLAVPLFDTAVVVGIRLVQGRPLFEGDRNHLAHRLLALGLSPRRTVLTVYALTLTAGLSAVLLYQVRGPAGALLILTQLLLTFALITLLEMTGRQERAGGPGP